MYNLFLGLILASCVVLNSAYDWDERTALDEYVQKDDGMYSWEVLTSYRFDTERVTVYVLNMTSQKWMDESFSNAPIWWHYQLIGIPDLLRRSFGYLWIEHGRTNPPWDIPSETNDFVTVTKLLTALTGYVGSVILQVPNQGVTFSDDPEQKSRSEDDFIAYTWKTYITTHQHQPEVIARLPMTKAAKRGLDTINQFVLSVRPATNITQFACGGGSKRGWTAWSLAVTDRRIVALTPVVMSLMNFNDTLQSHFRTLGGWTFLFYDYWEKGLTRHFHDDIMTNWEYGLWTYEDMFRYKERLAGTPKLLVSAGGDQYFLPTDSHTWWDELPEPKWFMMNPNAGHDLGPQVENVIQTICSWLLMTIEPLLPNVPQMVWLRGEMSQGGRILLNVERSPTELIGWVAQTFTNQPIRKDFRLHAGYPPTPQNVLWGRRSVTTVGPGIYEIDVPHNLPAFTAFFIEATWSTPFPNLSLKLTTEVHVTPDIYPFDSCYGEACYGSLV